MLQMVPEWLQAHKQTVNPKRPLSSEEEEVIIKSSQATSCVKWLNGKNKTTF
jgi:hypothetical protein